MGHCVLADVSYHCKCQCDGEDSKAGHSSIIEVNHHTHNRRGKEASVIATTIYGGAGVDFVAEKNKTRRCDGARQVEKYAYYTMLYCMHASQTEHIVLHT